MRVLLPLSSARVFRRWFAVSIHGLILVTLALALAVACSGGNRAGTGPSGSSSESTAPAAPTPTAGGGALSTCSFVIQPEELTRAMSGSGGTFSVSVETGDGCVWTVDPQQAFVTVVENPPAAGPGVATFAVAPIASGDRTGTIAIAGQTVTVTQKADNCSFIVSQNAFSVGPGGGTLIVTLETQPACLWGASARSAFLSDDIDISRTGTSVVRITVAPNVGPARSGVVDIATQSVTIEQAAGAQAGCTYSVSPTSGSIPQSGGSLTITVTTQPGCDWTTTHLGFNPFFTYTPASGTGSGSVTVTAPANPGKERSDSLRIAGRTVSLKQAGACPFVVTLTPQSPLVPAAGGTVTFTVQAPAACSWVVTVGPSFGEYVVSIDKPSQSGDGTFIATMQPNLGKRRFAPISVAAAAAAAGQTLASTHIIQSSGPNCASALAANPQWMDSAGGNRQAGVFTSDSDCLWTLSSNANWVTFSAGASGSGDQTFTMAVAPNTTGTMRVATVSAGGQTLKLWQSAPPPANSSFITYRTVYPGSVSGNHSFEHSLANSQFFSNNGISPSQIRLSWIVPNSDVIQSHSMTIAAPLGGTLMPGTYALTPAVANDLSFVFASPPSYRCESGTLTIHEALFHPDGTLDRFRLTFQTTCGSSVGTGEMLLLGTEVH